MEFVVGIFDLFAYSVPGALLLTFLTYLALRTGVLEPQAITGIPGVVLIIGIVVFSYLLGFITYPLGAVANKVTPKRRPRDPRAEFRRRNPTARGREYVDADPFLLLTALQLHNREATAEVVRLRASGLMLRNSAPALLLGAGASVVEAFAGPRPLAAVICALLFAVGFAVLISQGRKLGYWASIKTLEMAFWLPDVDDRFRSAQP